MRICQCCLTYVATNFEYDSQQGVVDLCHTCFMAIGFSEEARERRWMEAQYMGKPAQVNR